MGIIGAINLIPDLLALDDQEDHTNEVNLFRRSASKLGSWDEMTGQRRDQSIIKDACCMQRPPWDPDVGDKQGVGCVAPWVRPPFCLFLFFFSLGRRSSVLLPRTAHIAKGLSAKRHYRLMLVGIYCYCSKKSSAKHRRRSPGKGRYKQSTVAQGIL